MADVGFRTDCGVLGIDDRDGESSGLRSVCTWSPLAAELSVLSVSLSSQGVNRYDPFAGRDG